MSDMQQQMLGRMGRQDVNVDIVFVIDASESMGDLIEKVKDSALTFHQELSEKMQETHLVIQHLRIKVIWFRDFYFDGKFACGESEFFELPRQRKEFFTFVDDIKADGGGDDPESGLEALTLALRSDFVQDGDKRRHVIVLFTDQQAHAFEDYDELVLEAAKNSCRVEAYPANMPLNMSQFYAAWSGDDPKGFFGKDGAATKLDPTGRRLVLFAPEIKPWKEMAMDLKYVIASGLELAGNARDLKMSEVFAQIVYSLHTR